MRYYSPTSNGFYSSAIHGDRIPKDAVEISEEAYQELLNEQSAGKQITADSSGHPIAVLRTPSAAESAKAQIVALEKSITPRMMLEALTASPEVNPKTGNTSAQDISEIVAKIKSLRSQC